MTQVELYAALNVSPACPNAIKHLTVTHLVLEQVGRTNYLFTLTSLYRYTVTTLLPHQRADMIQRLTALGVSDLLDII
ncbi:hypothetical protein [Deinococcus kurensis]|uniref:hypothetical protein n=1 Tax=Deinococcus kurensis TaxID=2662757 RepID=UPI0012D335D7|nr:hypothetical protein [Deinococcus kurensis]